MTPQQARALAEANRVRSVRARMKRDLAAGLLSVPDVLTDPDLGRMPLGELLAAQRRWGPKRTARFLAALDMDATKRVGTLTARQRELIAVALDPASPTCLSAGEVAA